VGGDDSPVTPSLSALVPGHTSLTVSFQITGGCLIWTQVARAWNSCAATTGFLDSDGDGTVDEPSAVDSSDGYPDVDGDTDADALYPTPACAPPSGHIADGADCFDGCPLTRPGAPEGTDGVDDDCDGEVDEASGADADGFSAADGACDDDDGWALPGASELGDGIDNNRDAVADEGCDDGALGGDPIAPAKTGCATSGGGAPGALGLPGLVGALLGRRRRSA